MLAKTNGFKRKSIAFGVASAIALALTGTAVAGSDALALSIKEQKAGTALMTLGQQAGVQIIVPQELGNRLNTVALSGEYTLTEALELMLADSGLVYAFAEDDVVVISEGSEAADDTEEEGLEEIIVTGSAIRNVQPTSQMKVYTAEDISRLGVSSTEDFIRKLPQNFSGLNSFNSTNQTVQDRNGGGRDAVGSSAADLSGLGSDATLVLINGRRTAQSALFEGGVVNLATIPLTSIERVEILLDGASARYGADAVGGVINFITKKNYVGAETSVRYEDGRNGGQGYRINQLIGYNWGTGGVTATISYQERKPVSTAKLGADQIDQTARGGTDWTVNSLSQSDVTGAVYGVIRVADFCEEDGLDLSDPADLATCELWYGDPTEKFQGDLLGYLPANNDGTSWGAGDLDPDNQTRRTIFPKDQGVFTETKSFNLAANQDITDGINVYTELSYTNTVSTNRGDVSSFDTVLVPEDNPFNGFGDEVFVAYTPSVETFAGQTPYAATENESTRIDANIGFTADLPFGDWQTRVNFGYSEDKANSGGITDGSSEPSSFVRTHQTPEYRALHARFRELVESTNSDEALNLFGNGSAQSPLLSQVFGSSFANNPTSISKSFEAQADGAVFSTGGGDARLAVGVEFRQNDRDYSDDILREADEFRLTGFQFTQEPSQENTAVFAELDLPLISEGNSVSGVQSLRLNIGARWEEYRIDDAFAVDGVVTQDNTVPHPDGGFYAVDDVIYRQTGEATFDNISPRIGLKWQLVDDFSIQASWGEAFRAPNFSELLGTSQGSLAPRPFSPRGCVFDENDPRPLGSRDNGADQTCQIASLFIANPDLDPETSTTTTIGFEWTPSSLEGLTAGVDFRRTEFEDRITSNQEAIISNGDNFLQDQLSQAPQEFVRWEAGTSRAGILNYAENKAINFSKRTVEIVDFTVDYQFDTDYGDFRTTLNGVYTGTYDDESTAGAPSVNRVDTNLGPEAWKGRLALSWLRDSASANLFVNYSGSYDHAYQLPFDDDFNGGEEVTQKVGSYWTIDMTTAYDFDGGWRLELGANNLTNNISPFYDSPAGYDTRVYNPTGRQVYAAVKKTFEF